MHKVSEELALKFSDFDESNRQDSKAICLKPVKNKPVQLNFEGGLLSSDAGILLLKEVEEQIGLVHTMAEAMSDSRDSRYIKHTTYELLMQRIFQIASGYEDANDCNELREDPIFKLVCDRFPETDASLASQPTMTRFENRPSRTFLYRMARVLVDAFITSYEKEPKLIVLDFDDTENDVYGNQQLALFNGLFKEYCFTPLYVFEGISGKLITSILKPGKRLKGKQVLAILKRLVQRLRAHWPHTIILFRGDSHFSYPEVQEWIDTRNNVHFVTGYQSNSVIHKRVAFLVERAEHLYKTARRPVRLFHSISYKAKSWKSYRRVIVKVEVNDKGPNVRCVVTDLEQASATQLYQKLYCERGNAERYIKELKLHLKSDRTSCHRFEANQFRLLLHAAAYVLIHALQTNVLKHTRWARASMASIRLHLFKIGTRVRELKTRIKIELPTSFPLKATVSGSFQLFAQLRAG